MKRLLTITALIAMSLPMAPAQAAPKVEFLNPSGYSGATLTVSDKLDSDSAYHLVAWVKEVPSAPIVEFEIQPATGNTTTLEAQQRGTDTFEAFAPLGSFTDGTYTLRAIVYSGQSEVASTEKTIVVNRSDVPPPPTAETVEISYPTNGGQLGFFQPKGGRPATVVDGVVSGNAQQVRALYTLSDPGNAPSWTECGTGRPSSGAVRIRCTMAEADKAKADEVTALAMVANQTPPPAPPQGQADQTGDAHRVFPYVSEPSNVSVNPPTFSADPGACQTFVASVTDQHDRPIPTANVDIHAIGPDDQLRFGVVTNTTSGFQAPDDGHISSEFALECSDESNSDIRQGDHNVPAGDDTKHIESTGGTGTGGSFTFALYSATVGGTEAEVWVDVDDDDVRDPSEAGGGTVIGWGQPAPTPQPSIALDPEQADSPVGSCVKLTASVRQGGDPLANANVDFHIQGPDSSVAFCDPGGGSATRPPDQVGSPGTELEFAL